MDSTPTPQQLNDVMQRWNDEHAELSKKITEITRWLGEVSQLGVPRFGELAERLRHLRDRMLQHFDREDKLGEEMHLSHACVEVEATRRRAASDHLHLTERLDRLIAKLSELDPPFNSFQQAIDEVSLFVDAFEQHEEEESQGLTWLTKLTPRSGPPAE